jgi:regulator of cell morphogenesis and NO signaling
LEEARRNVRLPNGLQYAEWKLDFLVDYVTNVHHAYLYQALPSLESGLEHFIEGHKKQFPELIELHEIFTELAKHLLPHTRYEDEVIFPYMKQIDAAHRRKESYGHLFVRTLRKPLSCIDNVHEEISVLLRELQGFTNDYSYPKNACTNHQVIFHRLRELHDDMLQHMHLENNILYPKAKEIEQQLLGL